MEWIKCSEQMPKKSTYVIAADFKNRYPDSIPNCQIATFDDWFNNGNPSWDDGDGGELYLKEVTHWMPMPAHPTE